MIPGKFEYHAPTALPDAIALLERYGEDAKILAGGQSLIPIMRFRLAEPAGQYKTISGACGAGTVAIYRHG